MKALMRGAVAALLMLLLAPAMALAQHSGAPGLYNPGARQVATPQGPSTALDSSTVAYVNAVVLAGGPISDVQVARIDALIRGLKTDGIWPLVDRLWIKAAENSTQALIDLKVQATAIAVNSPTFTTARGYTGNATTAYIDTGFNAATAAGNYTQNNAGYGLWVYNDPGTSSSLREMGNDDNNWGEIQFGGAGTALFGVNQALAPIGVTPPARTGLLTVERTGAAATQAYRNGASLGTGTGASIAVASRNFFVLGANSSAGVTAPTNSGVAAAFIGASLGPSLQTAFYNRLRTYMTAVGVP